jgi:putative membrane protein
MTVKETTTSTEKVKIKWFNPANVLRFFFSGFAMGSAEIVPGVSGGTIAFILGIYEKLIVSIKVVTGDAVKLLFQRKFKEMLLVIPWEFLVPLALGMFAAVFALANLMDYLLVEYPTFVWSFFFGLVLASIFLISRRVAVWNIKTVGVLLLSALISWLLMGLVPGQTPATLPAFFIAGVIAICAMILPGVSGSFLLLMMGKYQQLLAAVTNADYIVLLVFMAGAVLGISVFSRILSWLFKNYENLVIASLIGLMLGSLRKLWPFKETVETTVDRHGEVIPLVTVNFLPTEISSEVVVAVVLCAVGIGLIILLNYFAPDVAEAHSEPQ